MAGTKISQLPALPDGTDISGAQFPASLSGTTYKVPGALFGGTVITDDDTIIGDGSIEAPIMANIHTDGTTITGDGSFDSPLTAVGSQDFSNLPAYINNSQAIADGKVNGDLYRTYQSGNDINYLAVVYVPTGFFIKLKTDSDCNSGFIEFFTSGEVTIHAKWGDGVEDIITGTGDVAPSHTYANPGIYTVEFTVDNPSLVTRIGGDFDANFITVNNVNVFENITELRISNAAHSDDKQYNSFNEAQLNLPESLQILVIEGTALQSFTPSSLPSSLTDLEITGEGFTHFAPASLPSGITQLFLEYTSLSESEINDILILLDGMTFNAGSKELHLEFQTPPASPSGAGLTAKASLESKGWTITTD